MRWISVCNIPGHSEHSDSVLWIGSQLALDDEVGRVLLALKTSGGEVAITHPLRIVNAEQSKHIQDHTDDWEVKQSENIFRRYVQAHSIEMKTNQIIVLSCTIL